ncbi:esterase/lipase family protein [Rhodococcus koreensis]|uniref:esterase/lipase family protein n=1 Tax=Rhodococcus koreensis TaxID=99653 RepID=UPI0036DF21C8
MAARARTVAVLGVLAVLGTPAVADAAPDKAPVGPPANGVACRVGLFHRAPGADRVDLVGHSQGGLVPLFYINHLGGESKIGTMIGVAPATHGISAYGMLNFLAAHSQAKDAVGKVIPAVDDGTAGSAFVTGTGEGGMTRPGVEYATVSSRHDLVVQLSESQLPPGPNVSNVVVQEFCPEDLTNHGTMVYDDITLRIVRNLLDPATAVAPACHPVAPLP